MLSTAVTGRHPLLVPAGCLGLGALLAGPLDVPAVAVPWLLAWLLWPVAAALLRDASPRDPVGATLAAGGLNPGWVLLVAGVRPDAGSLTGVSLVSVPLLVAVGPLALRGWRTRDAHGGRLLLAGTVVLVAALAALAVAASLGRLSAASLYAGSGLVAVAPFAYAGLVLAGPRRLVDAAVVRGSLTVLATLGLALAWVVVVALLATTDLPDQEAAAGVLTAVGALALLPVWTTARRHILARLYGPGRLPGSAHLDLARQIRRPQDHTALLAALADSVARALRSPSARVHLGDPVARDDEIAVPLRVGEQAVGALLVAPRSPGERFTRADVRLLDDLAPQLAVAAHAVALSNKVQAAHVATVTALEQERQRIYSDLHDVLGPLLSGLRLHVEAARGGSGRGADVAPRLAEVAAGLDECRREVRRLVHDLRREAGRMPLVEALRSLVADWQRAAAGGPPEFRAEIDDVGGLRPDVELALLRVAAEALTNVVRHASADCCLVTLTRRHGEVELRVEDDGRGLAGTDGDGGGVGLASMRHRLEAVGGRLDLETRPGGGTRVTARLPVLP